MKGIKLTWRLSIIGRNEVDRDTMLVEYIFKHEGTMAL